MITYPPIEIPEAEEVLNLSISLLGKNYHELDYFLDAAKNNQCIVAKHQKKIIGFITFRKADEKGFYNKCGHVIQAPSGLIDAIGVHPNFQKRGIGHQLLNLALNRLGNRYPQIVSLGWKFYDRINVEKLFLKNGFKQLKEIHHLWDKECNNGDFDCHVKDAPHCICSAVLFKKIIVE